ncbi:MAG TPA: bifunctional phosphoribosylaminoimidazolecarboxamide formyltransferase/IMP cyclohydrolase [Dehalococcoidia bacterium]|nr:bifunctional phosphoribosylaminoimidazolecarboxamide formyltransferase/IMP cyclohydrolase [Dehalococcoidia bacterium]
MIALIAPYDKTGAADLARGLVDLGFEIISTSGTLKHLTGEGIKVRSVSDLTGFPEILDGRVKTLHPAVHAGLLARRDRPEHMEELERQGLRRIDVVAVNLYPFRETVAKPGVTEDDALENIDIGGPTMLRAAAKNFPSVLVLVDPGDYAEATEPLWANNIPTEYRRALAEKAFQHVASYDTAIAQYLRSQQPEAVDTFPQRLTIGLEKAADLRYGENPHQQAAVYRTDTPGDPWGLLAAELLHGVSMSYLNYLDADSAWRAAAEFDDPTVVIVKHATPCGIASQQDVAAAYQRAYEGDEISPFGGIIAANREVTWDMTAAMKGKRYDIIIAPRYEDSALERLKRRRDLRILTIEEQGSRKKEEAVEYRSIAGGILAQTRDMRRASELDLRVMTKRAPTAAELEDLRFAWTALKHVKSNAIVVAKDRATVGIGCGQPNRLWATQHALEHAGERARGAVLASDAFFPFARGDAVEGACKVGVSAIIQPGGGVRDDEAVEVCNDYGVAMVFTGTRAFRH